MKLYNTMIQEVNDSFRGEEPVIYPYDSRKSWKDMRKSELIMLRDAAFELGGSGLPSVNCTLTTSDEHLVPRDEILIYGKDLTEIESDTSFMRIVEISMEDPGEDEEAYNAIKKLEFVRYNVFPRGYMSRVSSESNREQVRISRQARKAGISFRWVGNTYLKRYHEIPGVKHVRIIFVTGREDLRPWMDLAKKADAVTQTLTHIMDGISTDCGHCTLKPVCDSVEGLKEMHMKRGKK